MSLSEQMRALLMQPDGVGELTRLIGDMQRRIEKIEADTKRVSANEFHRQARWHETYNAALSGALANPGNDPHEGETAQEYSDTLHNACVAAADRAHGPLEGVS
jgi:hypothetical protein